MAQSTEEEFFAGKLLVASSFDVISVSKYMSQPAWLSLKSGLLCVYLGINLVTLVTALERNTCCAFQLSIFSLTGPEQDTQWSLIYFSTSVKRENNFMRVMLNIMGSFVLLTALLGETFGAYSTTIALRWLSQCASLIWEANSSQCCLWSPSTALVSSNGSLERNNESTNWCVWSLFHDWH